MPVQLHIVPSLHNFGHILPWNLYITGTFRSSKRINQQIKDNNYNTLWDTHTMMQLRTTISNTSCDTSVRYS